MGVSGLLTWLAKKPPGTRSCLGKKRGADKEKERGRWWCDGQKKVEWISAGGWHFTNNELAGDMTLKNVQYLDLILGKWQKATNGPARLLCEPSVQWLLFSSTVVQLGDSFTVAFPPSGQEQSKCTEPTQSCSNRPLCRTFQWNRD